MSSKLGRSSNYSLDYPALAGHILLTLIVVNAFYFRGFNFPSSYINSVSYFIPILSLFAVLYLLFIYRQEIGFDRKNLYFLSLLVFFITSSSIYNIMFVDNSISTLQFSIEIYLNILLLVCALLISRKVETQYVLNVLFVTGFLFSLYILYVAGIEADTIRRVGNTELPISVNHLSHALAASFAVGLCRFYYHRKQIVPILIVLSTILTAMMFTGSRSGYLAIGAVLGILMLIEGKKFVIWLIAALGAGVGTVSMISFFVADFTEGGGVGRLSYNNVVSSLMGRTERYVTTLEVVFSSPNYFSFGAGMNNYITLFSSTPIIQDPHNIWFSMALFFGVPAAIAFTILHLSIFTQGLKCVFSGESRDETTVTLLLILFVVSIYSFFSGRMTRIFTIWIIMGLLWEQTTSYYISSIDSD